MAHNPEAHSGEEFSYEDLESFTNNFSERNFIGRTQMGRLYRGKIPQGWRGMDEKDVIVKMWSNEVIIGKDTVFWTVKQDYLLARMKDDIKFLGLPFLEGHQNVAKVVGQCSKDEKLGVVYDLKPLDALRNIVYYKEKLGWRNRMKVAIGLARLLELIHSAKPQYLVRNLSAAHVIVDQNFNPVLVDFAMIRGGDIGDDGSIGYHCPVASFGYFDDYIALCGSWTERTDVYAFGIILLELISTCTYASFSRAIGAKKNLFIAKHARDLYECAKKGGEDVKISLVHAKLHSDADYNADDGTELTMLALSCVKYRRGDRPIMHEVVSKLEKLNLLKAHVHSLEAI